MHFSLFFCTHQPWHSMPRKGWTAVETPNGWFQLIRGPRPPSIRWEKATRPQSRETAQGQCEVGGEPQCETHPSPQPSRSRSGHRECTVESGQVAESPRGRGRCGRSRGGIVAGRVGEGPGCSSVTSSRRPGLAMQGVHREVPAAVGVGPRPRSRRKPIQVSTPTDWSSSGSVDGGLARLEEDQRSHHPPGAIWSSGATASSFPGRVAHHCRMEFAITNQEAGPEDFDVHDHGSIDPTLLDSLVEDLGVAGSESCWGETESIGDEVVEGVHCLSVPSLCTPSRHCRRFSGLFTQQDGSRQVRGCAFAWVECPKPPQSLVLSRVTITLHLHLEPAQR